MFNPLKQAKMTVYFLTVFQFLAAQKNNNDG